MIPEPIDSEVPEEYVVTDEKSDAIGALVAAIGADDGEDGVTTK